MFLPLAYFSGIEGFGFFLPYLLICFALAAALEWRAVANEGRKRAVLIEVPTAPNQAVGNPIE